MMLGVRSAGPDPGKSVYNPLCNFLHREIQMSFNKLAIAFAVATMVAGAAQAQSSTAFSLDIGSTGIGAYAVRGVSNSVNARLGLHYLKGNISETVNSIDYDVNLKLLNVDLLADWYPIGDSSFHLTGGAVYDGNQFKYRSKPVGGGFITVNGTPYAASQFGTLNGGVEFSKVAPYLGIGWGNALAGTPGWHFTSDVGAFYQNHGDVTLANAGCTATATVCQALARDVAGERSRLESDNAAPRFFPVLRVGVSYRF